MITIFKFHYVSINSVTTFPPASFFKFFKFHYVSINSEVKKYLDWRANGFKFHYVSINSFGINCSINSTFLL